MAEPERVDRAKALSSAVHNLLAVEGVNLPTDVVRTYAAVAQAWASVAAALGADAVVVPPEEAAKRARQVAGKTWQATP